MTDICAALRTDFIRQQQELASIRADCRAAAEGVGPAVSGVKAYLAQLVGDERAGGVVGWGLSAVGAAQAESACLVFMMWALHQHWGWRVAALLVNLVLTPPNGVCWALYLALTAVVAALRRLAERYPCLARCFRGGVDEAAPAVPAAAAPAAAGWFSWLPSWMGGAAPPAPELAHAPEEIELV